MFAKTTTIRARGSWAGVLAAGTLLLAACSGSGGAAPPSHPSGDTVAAAPATADASALPPSSLAPAETPAPVTTTATPSTLSPAIAVPIGVRWREIELPSEATLSQATSVVATGNGYVVLGKESQPQGGRPAIWTSADGETFTRADTTALSPPGNQVSLFDAAEGSGVTVAVGERSSSCELLIDEFLSVCYRHAGAAWFSADGQTWQEAGAADGSFDAGIITRLTDVVAFGGGFVAAGQVILDRNDWRLGVWTSADGAAWVRSALIDDPGGLFGWPSLARAGASLVIGVMVTRCESPLDVFGGFGFSVPLQNGRGFTSTNGADWVPIDLAATGLSRDDGPEACDRNPEGAGFVPSGVTTGRVAQLGESALWTGATGVFSTADATTWTVVPAAPDIAAMQDYAVDHVNGQLVGTGPGDLLGVVSSGVARGRATLTVAVFDGSGWNEWSELAGGIPAFGRSDHIETVGLDGIAKTGQSAVIVATISDDAGTAVRAVAFVSRATTFDPTATLTCTPAPAANCVDVDLEGNDLSGADLTGIDLRRAALDGVDLTGSNLSGANLDDSVLDTSDLSSAILTGASLKRVEASDATFDGADLSGVDASNASLGSSVGTIYRNAILFRVGWLSRDLTNADFRGADLSRAHFIGSDLTGALFDGATLERVLWGSTTCPDGYVLADVDIDCTGHFIG